MLLLRPSCLLLLAVSQMVASSADREQPRPRWSWATLQTYAHCSNSTGTLDLPLSPAVASYMAGLPFVVIEKTQGLASVPANAEAEAKIAAAARQLKVANASAHVLAYYQTDKVRTWYDSAVWFDTHPQYELRNTSGNLVQFPGANPNIPVRVFDYSEPAAQAHWAAALANATTGGWGGLPGDISGFFIDGPTDIDHWTCRRTGQAENEGGTNPCVVSPSTLFNNRLLSAAFSTTTAPDLVDAIYLIFSCTLHGQAAATRASWKAGLNATLRALRSTVGEGATIIGDGANNPLAGRNAYMIQSWFRDGDIAGAVSDLQVRSFACRTTVVCWW